MKSPIEIAVFNNIEWCDTVSQVHGITSFSKGNLWGLESAAPVFYPDIITTNSSVTTKEVSDFLKGRSVASIKDSFANLDLEPLGYKILFHAKWVYHPSLSITPSRIPNWHHIQTEKELANWNSKAGLEEVITPSFLKRKDVRIFGYDKDDQYAGFIANLGADAVGISNVFSVDNTNSSLWADMIYVTSSEFPNLPLVGYEDGEALKAAQAAGWEKIGSLRIWIRPNM